MADSPSNAASLGTPFAPRMLVPVNVGCSTVNLYPVINPSMQPYKHAHAFHINKTELFSQSINLRIQLNTLGHQLNLSATVKGMIHDWLHHYNVCWFDFSQLVILSFHDKKGNQVNNTMISGDPSTLLRVVDSAVANCYWHIKFVHVQLSINFIDLVTVDHPGPTTLRTEYYIELLQTTCAMTNETRTAYNLKTFHGAGDLRTLSQQVVQVEILNHTLQDGPVELQPAGFGATSARMDPATIRTEIKSKTLCLAYQSICHTLFLELRPGYSNQPHTALDHIRQVHTDCDGNAVSSSVQAYYQQLMSAS
jgi:hypothetical protein